MIQIAAATVFTKLLIFIGSFIVITIAGICALAYVLGKGIGALCSALFGKDKEEEAQVDVPKGEPTETDTKGEAG